MNYLKTFVFALKYARAAGKADPIRWAIRFANRRQYRATKRITYQSTLVQGQMVTHVDTK